MQIVLKGTKVTMESGKVVVKLEPALSEPRTGDSIAGELFLTTNEDNVLFGLNDEIVIEFAEEIEEPAE